MNNCGIELCTIQTPHTHETKASVAIALPPPSAWSKFKNVRQVVLDGNANSNFIDTDETLLALVPSSTVLKTYGDVLVTRKDYNNRDEQVLNTLGTQQVAPVMLAIVGTVATLKKEVDLANKISFDLRDSLDEKTKDLDKLIVSNTSLIADNEQLKKIRSDVTNRADANATLNRKLEAKLATVRKHIGEKAWKELEDEAG